MVGDGEERVTLEALADARGIRDIVGFAGWSSDTPPWYAAADMVTLTSDREGTPLALIEAAASGRPVVAGDVGGVADIVADGEQASSWPMTTCPRSPTGFPASQPIPDLRATLDEAAPARAMSFSADRLVADLDALYREALVDHRGVGRPALA